VESRGLGQAHVISGMTSVGQAVSGRTQGFLKWAPQNAAAAANVR
jgi:hypothetical protein